MMIEKSLSDVLEGYAIETPNGNDQEVLKRWMEENPEFADDLMDFAAARAQIQYIDEPLTDEEEMRYKEVGLNILASVLDQPAEAPPASLTAAAQEKGLKKPEFAKRLGLSVSLIMQLEKRRLQFATIPKRLIASIAELLELSEQSVASYLAMPPSLAGEVSFKTSTRPEEVQQKSFAEVVNQDQILTPPEKQRLLTIE